MGLRIWRSVGLAAGIALAACCPASAATVYVSNFTSNTLSQFAVAADGSLTPLSPATVATGVGPFGIAISPDRRSVYVANNGGTANSVSQFSVQPDGTLVPKSPATVFATRASRVAVSPDGRSVYVTAAQNPPLVSQFDVAVDGTLTPKAVPTVGSGVASTAAAIVVNRAGTFAYLGHNSNDVGQFSIAADGSLTPLTPAFLHLTVGSIQGLTLSADGQSVYTANRNAASVSRLAIGADGRLSVPAGGATYTAAGQPNHVTVSPDGQSLYTANGQGSATVSQFTVNADGSLTAKTPATVPASTNPRNVALSADGRIAYVPGTAGNSVSQYTVAADGALSAKSPATVPTGTGPTEAAYSVGPPLPPAAPDVVTGAASAVSGSGASLAGSVDPNGVLATYVFEYGPTLAFGSVTAPDDAGLGDAPVAVHALATGLQPGTTAYYRLVASSTAGTTFGAVSSFRTTGTPQAPTSTTLPATAVTSSSANVAGQVNPSGQQTAFAFEYGTSLSFGSLSAPVALDDADALEPVSASLTGLAPGTTYYVRVVASNATGTTFGSVVSFTTSGGTLAPAATTGAATAVTATGATLGAVVDPHGSATAFAFEYGPTNAFGSLSAIDSAGAGSGAQAVSLPITGLTPGTVYRFRIVATNALGTTTGSVGSFTTPPAT